MKGLFTVLKPFDGLSKRIDKVEALCENNCKLLFEENKRLSSQINKLEDRLEDQEQRSRNTCLLIHGIDEDMNGNTDEAALKVFNDDLGLNLDISSIQRSHRVGPKKKIQGRNTRTNKSNPRPIIVKFTSYRDRKKVYSSKKRLKGKRTSISENLTQKRYILYKQSQEKLGRNNVWTSDGHIMTKVGESYVTINSIDDLLNLEGGDE